MQDKKDENKKGSKSKKQGLNYLQWTAIIIVIIVVLLVIIIDYYYRKGVI